MHTIGDICSASSIASTHTTAVFDIAIDMDMVKACLIQMRVTNELLPVWVTDAILREIAVPGSDRDPEIFKRKVNPRGGGKIMHPDDVRVPTLVSEYVGIAKKWGLDKAPKETIMSEFDIKRGTYYAWTKEYSDDFVISTIAVDWSEARHEQRWRFNLLVPTLWWLRSIRHILDSHRPTPAFSRALTGTYKTDNPTNIKKACLIKKQSQSVHRYPISIAS